MAIAVTPDSAITDWLMAGDPAIRWQTLRDLLDAPVTEVEAERSRVETEGWGAELLGRQDPEGTWAGGLYSPKWTSTFYTLLLLRGLGLRGGNEQASRGALILLERGVRPDGGLNYLASDRAQRGPSETCISGMGLAICSRFLEDASAAKPITDYIVREQVEDGGWNCQRPRGATHSSFHTTISVLDGLIEWEQRSGSLEPDLAEARERAHEFLIVHGLFLSHTTGRVAHPSFTRFPYPPRWHYDALRGLDYLREIHATRDLRTQPAIDLLSKARLKGGRWRTYSPYSGRAWFEMERPREPSRWNTLRALRVLRWWGEVGVATPAVVSRPKRVHVRR